MKIRIVLAVAILAFTSGFGINNNKVVKVVKTSSFPRNNNNRGGSSPLRVAAQPSLPDHPQFFTYLDQLYQESIRIKCPFFRRRAADAIDGLAEIGRFLLIRHKSLVPSYAVAPGCRSMSTTPGVDNKCKGIDKQDLLQTIFEDWNVATNKGYYITGRLNTTVYRDDCFFSGPDPDMPVRGLRKYLSAAAYLFDTKQSQAKLISLDWMTLESKEAGTKKHEDVIVARWELEGVLMLPWRPKVPTWTGSTVYHFDEEGLICHHEEKWDISVMEAFIKTLFPNVGEFVWT